MTGRDAVRLALVDAAASIRLTWFDRFRDAQHVQGRLGRMAMHAHCRLTNLCEAPKSGVARLSEPLL